MPRHRGQLEKPPNIAAPIKKIYISLISFVVLLSWALMHDVARQLYVNSLNANSSWPMWYAEPASRFQGQPIGASKSLCGSTGTSAERAARLRAKVASGLLKFESRRTGGKRLPKNFDSAEHWPSCYKVISDIRDQSNCGCCWAFGTAEAASDRLCIATNGTIALPLSAQELCFCQQADGCDGGLPEDAWQYIQAAGLATGGQFNSTGPFQGMCADFSLPHCHHHGPQGIDPYPAEGKPGCPLVKSSPQCPTDCGAGTKTQYADFKHDRFKFLGYLQMYDNDADTIARAILDSGPISASFDVYDDFENCKQRRRIEAQGTSAVMLCCQHVTHAL